MSQTLDDLAFRLNVTTTDEGTTFDAMALDDDVLQVICSNNEEFPINIAITDTQILAVTPLFSALEVLDKNLAELNENFLRMSAAIPLSCLGKQGDSYILFGAMSVNTIFENIVHELEVQAENTLDVLEAIEPLLDA